MRGAWLGVVALVASACGGTVSTGTGDGGPGGLGWGGAGATGTGSGGTAVGGSGAATGGGGVGTGGGTSTGGSGGGAVPPPPDPNAPPASGAAKTFALNQLFLGDTDWSQNPSSSAWKQFGFDLDGQISSKTSSYHCQPVQGANPANVKTDGVAGIDNSFGSNLMPLFLSIAADTSSSINQSIQGGTWTLLFHFENLGSAPSQNGVRGALYDGAKLPFPPRWDGSDPWPITRSSLIGGDLSQPRISFGDSYVVQGTWVSANTSAPPTLALPILGFDFDLRLRIQRARITAAIAADGLAHGIIGGILYTSELIDELRRVAGALDFSLCEGSTLDAVAQQIRTASDILADGSQDPSRECDAISIGIGFSAKPARLGPILDAEPPPVDPCSMP